jgi:NADH-quinone oxidoreductase subunit J
MAEFVIFFIMAAIALGAAIGMVLARNPVHSALLLVTVLIAIAVMFLLQDAQLLAAVQIIVYAGAIVVLFLFVIMLLGVDRSESLEDPVRSQRPAAIALGVIGLAEVLFLAGRHWATGASSGPGLHSGPGGNVEHVARAIFTDYLWPFEVLTILLVVAVVGGVVLARRSGLPAEQEYDLERDDDHTTPSDLDPEDSSTEVTTP